MIEESDSRESFLSKFKEAMLGLGGCLVPMFLAILAIGSIALVVTLLNQMPWISTNLYPGTLKVARIALFFIVPTCSVLAFFRKGRAIGGLGLVLSSYMIGFSLWVWSLMMAYALAGVVWIIVGLLFLGIGVIPIAIVAAALNDQWSVAGQMIIGIFIVFTLRIIGNLLLNSESKGEGLS
jgi:hypothetical protein